MASDQWPGRGCAFYSVYVQGLHSTKDLKFTIDTRRAKVSMKRPVLSGERSTYRTIGGC